MLDIDKILFKVLLLDGNESTMLEPIVYTDFKELIIELTKIAYNIRYCTNKNCPCHPESMIKILLKSKSLCDFLTENNLLEGIKCLIEDYIPTIAKGIYED